MNRIKLIGILFISLFQLSLMSCKDKEELPLQDEKNQFSFNKSEYEVRLGLPTAITVQSGNKSYTVTVENPDLLEATTIPADNANPSGALQVTGKKTGETTLYVLDHISNEEVILKIKVTDFYLGNTVTETDLPLLAKNQRLFLVKNDNRHFYIFNEKTNASPTLLTIGNYELTTLAAKTYLTFRYYVPNTKEIYTSVFDLSETDPTSITLLNRYMSGKESQGSASFDVPHTLILEEQQTGKKVRLSLDINEAMPDGILNGMDTPDTPTGLFPIEDNSLPPEGSEAGRFKLILDMIDPESCLVMEDTKISDNEYQIIKDFTDELVKGITDPFKLYQKIFYWITDNIQYDSGSNDAYDVFINRKAVCEGYSNLLKVMLISQNIPTIIVHGDITSTTTPVAHAWNYSYLDGTWCAGDATNSALYRLNSDIDIGLYDKRYYPYLTDILISQDENFEYGYHKGISIRKIKNIRKKLTIPFSAMGYQIETIYLTDFPDGIQEFYIGSNIRNFGENAIGLKVAANTLENIFIAQNNATFESYEGSIYRKSEDIPYYIPGNKRIIQLKPVETVSKNIIVGHNRVEEIYFGVGTKTIENFAVENCPNLKTVFIPSSVTRIDENAFFQVGTITQIRY